MVYTHKPEATAIMANVGYQMRKYREEHGITLRQLARVSGYALGTLSRFETGKVDSLTIAAMYASTLGFELVLDDLGYPYINGTTYDLGDGEVEPRGVRYDPNKPPMMDRPFGCEVS